MVPETASFLTGFTAFDLFLAIVIGFFLIRLGRRVRPENRFLWRTFALFALFCFIADWVLLAALPYLQLSFGPVGPALLLVSGFRLLFFAPAFFLLHRQTLKSIGVLLLAVVILLQPAIFAVELDGFYVEPFRLGVTELPVHAPAFLPDRPLRILQLSDIHVERITKRERDMLAQVAALRPDIIVLTGDYVNSSYARDPVTLQQTRQLLSQLHAPYGVYAVNGNVDPPPVMSALFDGLTNVRVLNDEILPLKLPLGTLYFIGVTMDKFSGKDDYKLARLVTELPPDVYSILLYHSPAILGDTIPASVPLFLSGHTHGGQVRLPLYGAIFTDTYIGKRYEMGEYTVGSLILYVSRGIGMAGGFMPRIRFLCPPEMVLVELGK